MWYYEKVANHSLATPSASDSEEVGGVGREYSSPLAPNLRSSSPLRPFSLELQLNNSGVTRRRVSAEHDQLPALRLPALSCALICGAAPMHVPIHVYSTA